MDNNHVTALYMSLVVRVRPVRLVGLEHNALHLSVILLANVEELAHLPVTVTAQHIPMVWRARTATRDGVARPVQHQCVLLLASMAVPARHPTRASVPQTPMDNFVKTAIPGGLELHAIFQTAKILAFMARVSRLVDACANVIMDGVERRVLFHARPVFVDNNANLHIALAARVTRAEEVATSLQAHARTDRFVDLLKTIV
jgi:hypothetical protein